MFKRLLLTISLLVPVALGGVWAWDQVDNTAVAQTEQPAGEYNATQTITVVGVGSVSASPDVARASVGVETSGESVSEAVKENGAQMDAIMDALKAMEVSDKDIQTTNFSIYLDRYPEQTARLLTEEAPEPQPIYRVSNMVNVTIRDLERVSEVLDSVIEAGANNIWGVSFEVDDTKEAESEARAKAVADALERAQALADLGEVGLGPVMSMSEVVGSGRLTTVVAERAMGGGGGAAISPGEVEVTYQVQVTYFIER